MALSGTSLQQSIQRIAQHVIVLEGWKRLVLAIAMGAVSALALAPYHLFPVLLITLPVFVWLLDGAAPEYDGTGLLAPLRRLVPAMKIGWSFGFGYFIAGMWWVGNAFLVEAEDFAFLLPVAVLVLPAGLALFWGIGAGLARLAWRDDWTRIVCFSASLTLAEWLRGTMLTGLPWNAPGYAIMPTPLWMQSAALIGLYGMTFVALLIFSTPAVFGAGTRGGAAPMQRGLPVLAIILFAGHFGYGLAVLSQADRTYQPDIRLRIVQPALDQREKWDAAKEAEIMGRYFELSNANKGPEAASVASFSHVIWPESAFPFILSQRGDQLANIARLLPPTTSLITGAMRLEQAANDAHQAKVFNSLYVINGEGETVIARDKVHLVPFGEFLPFQNLLESIGLQQLTRLQGGFAAGNRRSVVDIPGTPAFLPLICYEIIYSGAVRATSESSQAQPKWIVNLTNDAWFGLTAGPYQHAHQAQVRAVEEGLPLVRAANNGISFVSDAYGRIEESLALGQRGVVDARLPMARSATLFSQTGNWPILVFICLIWLGLLIFRRTH